MECGNLRSSLEVCGDLKRPSFNFDLLKLLRVYDAVRTLTEGSRGASVLASEKGRAPPSASPSRKTECSQLVRWLQQKAASTQGLAALCQRLRSSTEELLRRVHPVIVYLHSRRMGLRPPPASLLFSGRPGQEAFSADSREKRQSLRAALAIEGGAMRGCVTAGMAVALHHLGFADCFDAVYGSSAGSLIGAYFIARQLAYEGIQIYYDWLPKLGNSFLDVRRIGRGLGLGCLANGDFKDLFCSRLGKPALNLDALLVDVFQNRQPLDAEAFFAAQEKQPLKVAGSTCFFGFFLPKALSRFAAGTRRV